MNIASEQFRELEDNEFNDPEFFVNAQWLSYGKVYRRFIVNFNSISS